MIINMIVKCPDGLNEFQSYDISMVDGSIGVVEMLRAIQQYSQSEEKYSLSFSV